MRHHLLLICSLFFVAQGNIHASSGEGKTNEPAPRKSALGVYEGYSHPAYKGFDYTSLYVPMRDSVQLAVDVFLPKKAKEGEKFPTIVYLTRYVRSLKAKFPFHLLKDPVLIVVPEREIEYFTSHGYACVIVDVRGSGASQGSRTMEFSPEEVRDGYEIVDWIISREWSDGKVASTGVSYVGTTAELLLVNKHPAVKACIPRSNIFDLYNHIVFPNGVRQGPFIKAWGITTSSLDENNFRVFGKRAKRLLRGINPVEGDRKKEMLAAALHEHESNFDVYAGMFLINYRDEAHPGTSLCANDYSIHSNRLAVEESGTAIYRIGGWYDGALCKSVFEGLLNTSNTERVLMGPWDHGPHDNASPFSPTKELQFDVLAEMLRFFDYHLKGIDNGIGEDKKIHYFTIGEEQWKTADTWPLPQQTDITYFLSADKQLTSDSAFVFHGSVSYSIDSTNTSGSTSRWNSQTAIYKNGPTDYPDRKNQSAKLLTFTTQPFTHAVEMTGHVIADLHISADATDAVVFCYIEDVAPDGSVTYVTEGMFRALHRKVSDNPTGYVQPAPFHTFTKKDAALLTPGEPARLQFDLLPISYQFKAGHALRLAIAGSDVEHFDKPESNPTQLTVHCAEYAVSAITIPVVNVPVNVRGQLSK